MTEEQYKVKVAELAVVIIGNGNGKILHDPNSDIEYAVHTAQNLLNHLGLKPESEYVP